MKKFSMVLLVSIFVFGFLGSVHATMITNGDFENGLSGWMTRGDVQVGDTDGPLGFFAEAQGMDGKYALLGLNLDNEGGQIRQDFKVPESGKVTISFNWAFNYLDFNSDANDTLAALIRDDDSIIPTRRITLGDLHVSGGIGLDHGFFTTTVDLSEYVTEDARLIFRLSEPSGGWLGSVAGIDNVSVGAAPVPEPSTVLLMGVGLVGLVGVGRKRFAKKS